MKPDLESQDARQTSSLQKLAAPLVQLLREPGTLDVVVNSDNSLWVNRLGLGFAHAGEFAGERSQLLLQGTATIRRIPFDHEHPILETIFPLTGDRIEGVIYPVVSGAVMAIRTRQKKIFTLQEMAEAGILTDKTDPVNVRRHHDNFLSRIQNENHLGVIRHAVQYRRNILLAGPTGSGKTTAANSVIAEWGEVTSGDRVVLIEDTPELQCSLPNHVQLLTTARITQADLLAASMRLIPTRIVVGEVREPEAARALLGAWNTGHSGGLATIHANDSLSALRKLETLVGGYAEAVRERIAGAINMVIFIDGERELPIGRKVREVLVISGYDQNMRDYSLQYV